jgi:hypothetical protein
MRRSSFIFFFGTVALTAVGAFACTGDDTNVAPPPASDAGAADATLDAPFPFDSAPPPEAGSGGPVVLFTYTFDALKKSEYAAFDLASGQRRGGLTYGSAGTNVSSAKGPWVLDQGEDRVTKMDPAAPWNAVGTWSVSEAKTNDAGLGYSDPYAVAETDTKAYVALFNRNAVPVLDTTKVVPDAASAPAKTIDLTGLVQAGDKDGYVDASAVIYDAKRNKVWLVLGNIDLGNVDPQGFFAICTPGLHSTIIGIDVATDTLDKTAITLKGVSPTSVVYDAANDRLLVLSAGCNQPVAQGGGDAGADGGGDAGADAGGPGPMTGRLVESIDLTNGSSVVLLDANAKGFPGPFTYVGPHQAYVALDGVTYAWDPGVTTLGAPVPNAPPLYAWDGKGRLVGPQTTYLADGGIGSIALVAVDTADGGVTQLASSAVTSPDPGGFFENVDLWPHP